MLQTPGMCITWCRVSFSLDRHLWSHLRSYMMYWSHSATKGSCRWPQMCICPSLVLNRPFPWTCKFNTRETSRTARNVLAESSPWPSMAPGNIFCLCSSSLACFKLRLYPWFVMQTWFRGATAASSQNADTLEGRSCVAAFLAVIPAVNGISQRRISSRRSCYIIGGIHATVERSGSVSL